MIEIHKITDDLLKNELSEKCNIVYDKDKVYLGVFEHDELLEYAVYMLNDELSVIEYISNQTNEFSLLHGLMKTLIFLSDIGRVKTIILPIEYTRIAKALAFKNCGDNYALNLGDYQKTCCGLGEVENE